MPCSVDGCDRDVQARGWCKMHWQRWSRYGVTASQALDIRQRVAGGETHKSVAAAFDVAKSTVGMIVAEQTWRHLLGADREWDD